MLGLLLVKKKEKKFRIAFILYIWSIGRGMWFIIAAPLEYFLFDS